MAKATKNSTTESTTLVVRLPRETMDLLDALAEKGSTKMNKKSRSAVAREAIDEGLKHLTK